MAVLVVSLEKHVPYVGLEREHTALKEWWRKLIMVETLQKHIEIFEFGPVEECLIGYAEDVKQMGGGPAGGTSDRAVEAWKGLREHRDHLVELAKVELVAVISESVMENVKACLEKHVVYGKHVEEERALVTERMSYLQKRVDLYDLRGSDDFKAIDTAIVDYQDDDDPHIRALIPPLEERATQLAKAVKMALSELVEYVAPVAMGNALKRYADYQRMCPREYAAVSVRRDELCQDAAEAIAVALARKQPMSRKELEEMLKKYKSYPPELMNGQLGPCTLRAPAHPCLSIPLHKHSWDGGLNSRCTCARSTAAVGDQGCDRDGQAGGGQEEGADGSDQGHAGRRAVGRHWQEAAGALMLRRRRSPAACWDVSSMLIRVPVVNHLNTCF